MRFAHWVLVAVSFAAWSCGDDVEPADETPASTGAVDGPGVDCDPGSVIGCMCPDGQAGEQMCFVGEVGPCVCGGADPDTGDSGGSEGTDATSGGASQCGDGIVDEGEQCDDGDRDDTNDCSNACVVHCGLIWEATFAAALADNVAVDADGNITALHISLTGMLAEGTRTTWNLEGEVVSETPQDTVFVGGDPPRVHAGREASLLLAAAQEDGEAEPTNRLYSYALDGSQTWRIDLDAALDLTEHHHVGEDGDGNVVVTAPLRVARGDSDVWVAKYSAADGTELWTSTYSGPLDGGFSLDFSGPLAAASDGGVVVAGSIRQDFERRDVYGIAFGADGGEATWALPVEVDPGGTLDLQQSGMAIAGSAPSGTAAIAANLISVSGVTPTRWSVGIVDAGSLRMSVSSEDVEAGAEGEAAFNPRVALGDEGLWVASVWEPEPGAPLEMVVARFDEAGAHQCSYRMGPDRLAAAVALLADGSLAVVGPATDGQAWTGRFRP